MSEVLDNQQLNQKLQQLEKEGRADKPYIYECMDGSVVVTFFGSIHSSDPANPQWEILESKWGNFLDHDNPDKVLLFEKAGISVDAQSKEGAIIEHGESGLALWLANRDNVPAISPQQNRVEEVKALKSEGFTDKQIMTYYFARQMHQWARQDKQIVPLWEKYMRETVELYKGLGCWDEEITYDRVLSWYETETGKEFNEHDVQAFYDMSDPMQNSVSGASGRQQDIALQNAIMHYMDEGQDVFVVYGSGHAIRLEPALRATFNSAEKGENYEC